MATYRAMVGCASLGLGLALSSASGQLAFPGQAVAVTGQPAFGSPSEQFFDLRPATINPQGVLGFTGRTVSGAPAREGLYRWHAGQGSVLARQGEAFANHPSAQYHTFDTPVIDAGGRFAFYASYSGSTNHAGIVTGSPGQFAVEVLTGADPNPAPNPGYRRLDGPLDRPLHTRSGRLAFREGQTSPRLWGGTTGNLQVVAQFPFQAPDYPAGTTFSQAGFNLMDDSGQMLGMGQMYGGGLTGERGLLLVGPQAASVPAGPGRSVPGIAVPLYAAGPPGSINGSGRVGFAADYQPQPGQFRSGAWTVHNGSYQLLALSQSPAPGLPAGYVYTSLDTPTLNHSGGALFFANASGPGPDVSGLWIAQGGNLNLAMKRGDAIQNLPAGTTFQAQGGTTSAPVGIAFNDLEQVALTARLNWPGGGTRVGLLVDDPALGLLALAVTGLPYQLAPGDIRTVQDIFTYSSASGQVLGGDDGYGTFLNDSGQLTFNLKFTDGSMATIVTQVPAPPVGMVGLLAAALVRRRRR